MSSVLFPRDGAGWLRGITTRLRAGGVRNPGFIPSRGQEIFTLLVGPITALGPTQFFLQSVPEIKRLKRCIHFHILPSVRMSGALPPLHLHLHQCHAQGQFTLWYYHRCVTFRGTYNARAQNCDTQMLCNVFTPRRLSLTNDVCIDQVCTSDRTMLI